jgi:excisionase family DNA binding protein
MPANAPAPLAHRASDVSDLTGYSKAFVYRLIDTGKLPAVRCGRSIRVMHDDLVAFLADHRDTRDAS